MKLRSSNKFFEAQLPEGTFSFFKATLASAVKITPFLKLVFSPDTGLQVFGSNVNPEFSLEVEIPRKFFSVFNMPRTVVMRTDAKRYVLCAIESGLLGSLAVAGANFF